MTTTSIFKHNLKLFVEKKQIIVNEGGQHSSKTYSILQFIIFLAHNVKNKVFTIVAESLPFLKVGAIRQFIEILQMDGIYNEKNWNRTDHIYCISSNTIEFKAYDTPSKALGAKRDFLFINECINISYETYINLESRTNICTFLDYNPSYEFWIHDKVLNSNRDDVGYVHSTYKDNPFLPEKIKQTIERYKNTDPNRWKVMGEGLVGSNDGLVFTNWSILADLYETGTTMGYGLDFGFTNDPTACVSEYKSDNDLYVDELFYKINMSNGDICKNLDDEGVSRNSLIVADNQDPKSIDDIEKRGFKRIQGCTKGPDSINQGITLLKEYHMYISPRSVNLIKELRGYYWLKDKNGNLLNIAGGTEHAIDALRYIVSEKYSTNKRKSSTKIRIL